MSGKIIPTIWGGVEIFRNWMTTHILIFESWPWNCHDASECVISLQMCYTEPILRNKSSFKLTCLASWTHWALISLCWILNFSKVVLCPPTSYLTSVWWGACSEPRGEWFGGFSWDLLIFNCPNYQKRDRGPCIIVQSMPCNSDTNCPRILVEKLFSRKRDTDVQNRLLDSVGECEGGMFIERTASKHVYYQGWNRSPAQVGCMRQVLRAGALGTPRVIEWRGRWEGGLGWGIHVNPWLIHVSVWQKPLQYYKVISLQLIKINGEKKQKAVFWKRYVPFKDETIFDTD